MGLFRKKEKISFERDSTGRVVDVRRSGDVDRQRSVGAPETKRLLAQASERKKEIRIAKREKAREARRVYQQEYEKAKHSARIKRARLEGKRAGSTSAADRLGGLTGIGGYSTRNNYNPFGSMFDTGMDYKKPYKSKTSKKRKKSSSGRGGFDLTDNWGFMR